MASDRPRREEADIAWRALGEAVGHAGREQHRLDGALFGYKPCLNHHLEQHLSKLLVGQVCEVVQLFMPHRLGSIERVVVLVGHGACQGKETLTEHLLCKLSNEFVSTTCGGPHQVATLGGCDIGEDLKLTVGKHRQTVDGFSHPPDTRGVGSRLQEVLPHCSVSYLRPVTEFAVYGCQDGGLPRQEAASSKRQRVTIICAVWHWASFQKWAVDQDMSDHRH